MKRNLSLLLCAAGAAVLFSGCETQVVDRGAYLPENVAVNDVENRTALVLLNRPLQQTVTCPGIQETRLPDGRLQVAAHLRNRANWRVQVQANCEFKDGQGFVIDSTPFQPVFLDPNAQQDVQFVSANDKALRYTIRIREAR